MENYVSNTFNINYAQAWAQDQGGFSHQLANNFLAYLNKNKITAKKCLDICCGTSEFLGVLARNEIECYGTEIAQSMIDYSKAVYPNFNYKYCAQMYEIPFREKFDIISCNHDMVNTLERFDEWNKLFKNAYSSLEKNGVFMFDYYTKNKLSNWNEVTYEEGEEMDHVVIIKKGMDNKCIMNQVYYMKNDEGLYSKTFDVVVEAYFENADIVNALVKAGFKKIEFLNMSLERLENPETRNRIHVIARK